LFLSFLEIIESFMGYEASFCLGISDMLLIGAEIGQKTLHELLKGQQGDLVSS
jgi:hypothetical protein